MKIWGNNSSGDGSPSSSPLAEKAKARMIKGGNAHHRSSSSSGAVELEPLPVISTLSSTDGGDTCTTNDEDSKYAVHPEQLKEELREGRQVADAISLQRPSKRIGDIEDEENPEREAPTQTSSSPKISSSGHKKHEQQQQQPKADPHQSEEPTTNTGSSNNNKKGSTLSRMLFSSSSKDAQQPASRDQVKVIYRQFGPEATEVLTVEHDAGGMPSPNAADHVVVKIQVRLYFYLAESVDCM